MSLKRNTGHKMLSLVSVIFGSECSECQKGDKKTGKKKNRETERVIADGYD